MRNSIALVLAIVCSCRSVPAATAVFIDSPLIDWGHAPIVYAEVISSHDFGNGVARVKLRVVATLAGRLDAPAEPVVDSEIYYGYPTECVKKPPPARSRCIVLLGRCPADPLRSNSPWRHTVYCAFVPIMPDEAYLFLVSGLDDPKVAQIIPRMRKMRASLWPVSDSRLPRAFDGSEQTLWDDRSVVLAEVASQAASESPVETYRDRRRAIISLDVKATIAGCLDAALDCRIAVRIAYGYPDAPIKAAPKAKSKVVAVLRRMGDGRLAVSEDYFGFMPDKSPILVVGGFDDPMVAQIASRLNELRTPPPAGGPRG
jgi:hypothetical protein